MTDIDILRKLACRRARLEIEKNGKLWQPKSLKVSRVKIIWNYAHVVLVNPDHVWKFQENIWNQDTSTDKSPTPSFESNFPLAKYDFRK